MGDGRFQMTTSGTLNAKRWSVAPTALRIETGSWEILSTFPRGGFNDLGAKCYLDVGKAWASPAFKEPMAFLGRAGDQLQVSLIEMTLECDDISNTFSKFGRSAGMMPPGHLP